MNKLTKALGTVGIGAAAAFALATEELPVGRFLASLETPDAIKEIFNPDRKFDRNTLVGNLNTECFDYTSKHEVSEEGNRMYRHPGLYEDRAKAIEILATRFVELENGTISKENLKDLQKFIQRFEAYDSVISNSETDMNPLSYAVRDALIAHKAGDTLKAIDLLREERDAIRAVNNEARQLFSK